jgi:uncharacterized protein (TIGR02246 family)
MMSRTILFASILFAPLAGIAQTSPTSQPSDTTAAIAQLRGRWAAALHDKRLDDCVSLYAADATFLDPRGSRIEGQQALQSIFQLAFAAIDSTIEFSSVSVQSSGDLAFDSGSYKETVVPHGRTMGIPISGNYLTVYKRSPDGRWLIVQQAWTANTDALQRPSSAAGR